MIGAMREWVQRHTGGDVVAIERVQSLWEGYGTLVRVRLAGGDTPSVIVKEVTPPAGAGLAHARKLRSYDVERAFYTRHAARCDVGCRVPRCIASERTGAGVRLLLEDLDAAGFPERRRRATPRDVDLTLRWLARFHAGFLGEPPAELWPTGTYWHLGTRPDELAAIPDRALRQAALRIDARLEAIEHPTLVHGDAKLENFAFGAGGAAAFDFQYVGRGPAVKDVVYLLFSARGWSEDDASDEPELERYLAHLIRALHDVGAPDPQAVVNEQRALHPWARADFLRFYAGWAPSARSLELYRRAVRTLDA